MRGRRSAVGALLAVVAVGLASCGGGGDAPRAESPDHLRTRIEREAPALEREGIYVTTYWLGGENCEYGVGMGVVNPTPPNVAALHRRFGTRFCLERSESAPRACAGAFRRPQAVRRRVPDLRDRGIASAQRHAIAAGFSSTIDCPGFGTRRVKVPEPASLAAMARVTRQWPAPGMRWPVNRPIALEAVATLPGGFTYTFTGLGSAA